MRTSLFGAALIAGLALAFVGCSAGSNTGSNKDSGIDQTTSTGGTTGSGGTTGVGGAAGSGTGGAAGGDAGGATDGGAGGAAGSGAGGATDGGAGGAAGATDAATEGGVDAPAADGSGAPGVMVISVPYTASDTMGPLIAASFATTMALNGHTYNFALCMAASTATPSLYTFQPFATNFSGMGTYGATASFTTLSTCPTMTTVSMAITDTTVVAQIGLWLKSVASDGGTFGTATLEVDSVTVTGDPVGPYDFASTTQGFAMSTFNMVTGTTVTWQAAP